MLRAFFLIYVLLGIATLAIFGFRGQKSRRPEIEIFPDMVRQMKVRPQSTLDFFADGRGSRVPVPGTVPLGYQLPSSDAAADTDPTGAMALHPRAGFSEGTDYYNTGKISATNWGTGIPLEVNAQLMERGRQRYTINCAVCHGASGAGNGITSQFGLTGIASYHDNRLRTMADGELFNTITNGKGQMFAYGPNIMVADRWAIVAYVRALQRSQFATVADVPPEHVAELDKPETPAKP